MSCMNFMCVVCQDVFDQNDQEQIYATSCGHFFHKKCIDGWSKRSKTCPQCRKHLADRDIHRMYFDFINSTEGGNGNVPVGVLQERIQKLNVDLSEYKNKYNKKKAQNLKLKQEVVAVQDEGATWKSTVSLLQHQIKQYKAEKHQRDIIRQENITLKRQLKDVELVDKALKCSLKDVDDLVSREENIESVALLAVTLKKALLKSNSTITCLDQKYKSKQIEMGKLNRDYDSLKATYSRLQREYDEAKDTWAKEKEYLTDIVEQMKMNGDTPTREQVKSSVPLKRILNESPMPLPKRRLLDTSNLQESPDLESQVMAILQSDSPYLPVKTNSLGINLTLNNRPTQKSFVGRQISIFKPMGSVRNLDKSSLSPPKTEEPPKKSYKSSNIATMSAAKYRKLMPIPKK